MIDFFGPGFEAAEAMGLLPRLRQLAYPVDELNSSIGTGDLERALTIKGWCDRLTDDCSACYEATWPARSTRSRSVTRARSVLGWIAVPPRGPPGLPLQDHRRAAGIDQDHTNRKDHRWLSAMARQYAPTRAVPPSGPSHARRDAPRGSSIHPGAEAPHPGGDRLRRELYGVRAPNLLRG